MSNLLARCAAIGLLGWGFAATGDLGWLAARGLQLVNARTVPSERAACDPLSPPPPPLADPSSPGTSAADPFRGAVPPRPTPRGPADPTPPLGGPERLDLATLRAGDRISVWIGTAGGAPQTAITFDLVDPVTGEALLMGRGVVPRRVTIRGGDGTRSIVSRGDAIRITPAGHARQATAGGEALGPVTAIAVGR